MAKTINEIVRELQAQGHNVIVYQRTDTQGRKRGMVIRKIDQMTFQGSKGNEYARQLLNVSLPEYLQEQLDRLNKPQGKPEFALNKLAPSKRKKEALNEEVKKRIRRVQRLYRKKGSEYGLPTTSKYRWNLKHYGQAEAERLLEQAERYALGLAYDENIQTLINRLKQDNDKIALTLNVQPEQTSLYSIIQRIESYPREKFTEDMLKTILNATYRMEQRANSKDIESAISTFVTEIASIL